LTRQNQIYEFKYNYASASWASYQVDMGYIGPNTLVGNLTTATGYGEEYEFVDYNDSVQKALNYTEGVFQKDWLSGVIYSSIDPVRYSGGGGDYTIFNHNSNEFIGLPKFSSAISGVSIPAFALTRGKSLKLTIAGTFSKLPGSITGNTVSFTTRVGDQTFQSVEYANGGIGSTASFMINYDLKVRYAGQSGSVIGFGSLTVDETFSPSSPVFHFHQHSITSSIQVNTATAIPFDVRIRNSGSSGDYTILSSTLERLA